MVQVQRVKGQLSSVEVESQHLELSYPSSQPPQSPSRIQIKVLIKSSPNS